MALDNIFSSLQLKIQNTKTKGKTFRILSTKQKLTNLGSWLWHRRYLFGRRLRGIYSDNVGSLPRI